MTPEEIEVPAGPVSDKLAAALGSGSFPEALQLAVANQGLTLDRLQDRLAKAGHPVSTTILSYWSHGRSQPERDASLAALAALEPILGLKVGSLSRLLGKPRPRGRTTNAAVPTTILWADGDPLDRVLAELDCPYDGRRTLSLHDRYRVDEFGAEAYCRISSVIEATRDGVDRILAIYHDDTASGRLPHVTPTSGARVGRLRRDSDAGFTVTEMHLDEVLQRGHRTCVEYELHFEPGGERTLTCERHFAHPVRQYVLEVEFAPHRLPARCYLRHAPVGSIETVEEVRITAAHVVRHIFLDLKPGLYGIEFEWPRQG
ncbi:hypothetical protein [Nocardioides sp.]|uniref:hypothetical protein n=1 Tax=Nocardioides sp. TaxID=35761 RepID=UPI002CA16A42|nr:hypothetical protein [Nocardioides sp.]HXH81097.1 hypothetical protein [Nocardioides sp.]